ncbi:MAG: hypothetical protein ACFFCW_02100 [Candidatus Hodarchaeota archaeon]
MAANLVTRTIEDAESPLVRHLMKHQRYCQVLIDICSEKNFLIYEHRKILMLIEMCIKLELDLIQHLQLMINKNNCLATNFLLHKYKTEEKTHYNLFNQLIERVFRDEPK